MTRFLFVFPPLVGHIGPALGVAEALSARGHDVAWVTHEAVIGDVLSDATVYPAGEEFLEYMVEYLPERDQLKGLPAVKFLWEKVLVPMALHTVGPVRTAVDEFGPDVIVADQQAFAGAVVAVERGLPWAGSACGTAELQDPALVMPKVAAWFDRQIEHLLTELGHTGLIGTGFDPRFSPQLLLQYSTLELVGTVTRDVPGVAFVGPSLPRWAEETPFPWDWLDIHPRNVLVTMGTVSENVSDRFVGRVLEAVDGQSYGVILVAPPGKFTDVPANVLKVDFVPQLSLLPHLDAIVFHGGHNTLVGALSHGVPVVCAPIRDDEPILADQVSRAGAGIRVNHNRGRAEDIAAALAAVLEEPSYREAAARIQDSFAKAGGPPLAAELLEGLVGHPTPFAKHLT